MVKESLLNTYVWPWGGFVLAAIVLAAAAAGALRVAWRAPRVLIVLAIAFGPYAVFHPLFHDVANVRNALPLVLPVAYLAVVAIDALGRRALAAAATAAIAASLWAAAPASADFRREGSPTFRMLDEVRQRASEPHPLGMHAAFRRAIDWAPPLPEGRLLETVHGYEWLRLIEHWRAHPDAPAWFAADPRRTDLALIDPAARRHIRAYRWSFIEPPYVGGARPGSADWFEFAPPGWMLDRGWALTAEVAGITTRERLGPHIRPSVAWIRTRAGDSTAIVGGRHVGTSGSPAVRLTVALDDAPLSTFEVTAGFFVRRLDLPAGALAGAGYRRLTVGAQPAGVPVVLEQFDLQSPGVPMMAFESGWHEPEYNLLAGKSWRWMSDRAVVWVRPAGRDITLRISGESPLRYFDRAPTLKVSVGDAVVAEFSPAEDFSQDVVLADGLLSASAGRVVLTSDRHFVPGERDGTGDRRRLAVRVYTAEVR